MWQSRISNLTKFRTPNGTRALFSAVNGQRCRTNVFATVPTTPTTTKSANSFLTSVTARHESVRSLNMLAGGVAPAASRVLVLGSGGLSIGQAGEFDYSGSQAIKALKEEGVHTILINPNIATIQTGKDLADQVYFLPVTPEFVEYVIQKERPDGILLTFGGQTALNCGVALNRLGIFEKYNVKVLGTPVQTLITSEDRDLFNIALGEINIPVARSVAVKDVESALSVAKQIGYPVIVRAAFALGGLGSGFADNEEELQQLATKSLSLSGQILVEKSMKGWKELEYEVVRDREDNCITVCNMENFDPLGVHTGDSIVVAPSQTLTDDEYHMLRSAAIKIVRHVGVVGECNVQYALNPESREFCVIEMNARLSRSSALASKATGYPLAFVAAKIALGATLPEIANAVTKSTKALFEPSLDYIVCKIPRWDLKKFQYVSRHIGSAMKSVGEVMGIGRTFEEAMQKAVRMVDTSFAGFQGLNKDMTEDELNAMLTSPTDERLFAVGEAMLNRGYSVDRVHELTKIDKWFLYKLKNIVNTNNDLGKHTLETIPQDLMLLAKQQGFSDKQIARKIGSDELTVRAKRKSFGIIPSVKQIDTLAAEFPAATNYLYTTYNAGNFETKSDVVDVNGASADDVTFNDHGVMVLGSGVYRIGSSVEFDWCGVSCIRRLREMGHKTIMLNYNPETVSTDFDECDKLYFDEISLERALDVYEREGASGLVVSVGGQIPQNISLPLLENGVNVLGTSPTMIHAAENRYEFSRILDKIGVDQPEWKESTTLAEAEEFAKRVGYPVLIRPSFVLSGAAMKVAYDVNELEKYLLAASDISPEHPVVITKFINGAKELDIDAVAQKGNVVLYALSEHVENAGVHSGDATLLLPSPNIPTDVQKQLQVIIAKVAQAFEITGPFNMQVIWKGDELKVIECNLRASRSFPFVSKVLGTNFISAATDAMTTDAPLPSQDVMGVPRDFVATKVPQFSFTRLAGADPVLGVEMASTGEVACFGRSPEEAYLLSLLSVQNFRLPQNNVLIGFDDQSDVEDVKFVAQTLHQQGFGLFASGSALELLKSINLPANNFTISHDKRHARKAFQDAKIDLVINVARRRPDNTDDIQYMERRTAVDFGVPLINDSKCAVLFSKGLAKFNIRPGMTENPLKSGVQSWNDWSQ